VKGARFAGQPVHPALVHFLSCTGLVLLALGSWYGRRMVYEYGADSSPRPGRPGS
jgi:uncharacterized membrane protein